MVFRLEAEVDGATRRFALRRGENVVGSAPHSDVRLEDPTVSRHHAVLLVVDRTVEIADLGSQNGTFVDGRRLEGKTELAAGPRLRFGTVEAVLSELTEDDASPATLPRFAAAEAGERNRDEPASAAAGDVAAEAGVVTTASVSPLQVFALVHLPRLVDGLSRLEPGETASAARRVGEALGASLPCRRLEITQRDAVLYRAEPGDGAPDDEGSARDGRVEARDGELALEVDFGSASAGRLYAPLVETLVRLLAWSRTARPAKSATSRPRGDHSPESLSPDNTVPDNTVPDNTVPPPLPEPATVDPELRAIYERAATVADSELHVLIEGASGTGKELLARYVHRASPRREAPFVALNCAALPGDLLEAELFGIEKGVATGVYARPGRFEQADGGTLFLDEIGDMALSVQAKILRVLQEREVHRLGALEARPARVRVISATHQDVDELRADGRFRDDLFHRIADWRVRIPTLAERSLDIPNLAAHFLEREARQRGLEVHGISRAALRVLCRHPWPGNVRQLEREIAKAALFADGGLLDTGCLDPALVEESEPRRTLREHLEVVERRQIRLALEATGHDVPQAAEDLGIPASTLYRKIRGFGLDDGESGEAEREDDDEPAVEAGTGATGGAREERG